MSRVNLVLLCFVLYTGLLAQDFKVAIPKNADVFTRNFLLVYNDAPNKFIKYKGKLISLSDTVHLKSSIFQLKKPLPGQTAARYIEDSTYYVEYFFGEYADIASATEALQNLSDKVGNSFNDRMLLLKNEVGGGERYKEYKFAYALHSGFFHYNVSLQLNKVKDREAIRLVLQIFNGRPVYYHWIPGNQPIQSFNFANAVQRSYNFFETDERHPCQNEIPAFRCDGIQKQHDSIINLYIKEGFIGFADAKLAYDMYVSDLSAGLGKVYVSWPIPEKNIKHTTIAYTKFDDVDKWDRKTILFSLKERSASSTALENGKLASPEYYISLSFSSKE